MQQFLGVFSIGQRQDRARRNAGDEVADHCAETEPLRERDEEAGKRDQGKCFGEGPFKGGQAKRPTGLGRREGTADGDGKDRGCDDPSHG